MAKSKSKTNTNKKTKQVADDELDVKPDDVEEVEADDADVPQTKSKTGAKKKSKAVPDEDADEDLVLNDADDVDVPQSKSKSRVKKKSKHVADEDADEESVLDDADDLNAPTSKSKTSMKKTTKHVADDEVEDAEDVAIEDDDAPKKKTKHVADDDDKAKADEDAEDVPVDDAEAEEKPDEDDEKSVDKGPKPPPAKLTKTAIALIILNWILAPTFLTFAYMDSVVRTQYAYRGMLNYIQAHGLPLKSEEPGENHTPASMDTRPRLRMTPEQLQDAFKQRTRNSKNQNFVAVEEPLEFRLRPSDMKIQRLKDDVFQGVPDPVETLDEAIEKLQASLPAAIKSAADEVVEKNKKATDDEKRAVIAKIVMPMAWDVWQVEKLDARLAKTKGADLDKLLEDVAQRRMYYDIMAPLNIYKPGDISDVKHYKIEKLSSLDDYDINQVKKFMTDRLSAAIADNYNPELHLGKYLETANPKRDSIEKRHQIAFILFTLSQISVPTLDKKLIPKGIERAQVISGLHEFTDASIHYVRAVRVQEERMVAAIKADREGYVATLTEKQNQLANTPGFIAEYEAEVTRLIEIIKHIDTQEKRLANLKLKKDEFEKIHEQRVKQHDDTLAELLAARKNTESYAKALRVLQDQLHRSLVELSDASEVNFQLYEQIYDLEMKYLKKTKGGKK